MIQVLTIHVELMTLRRAVQVCAMWRRANPSTWRSPRQGEGEEAPSILPSTFEPHLQGREEIQEPAIPLVPRFGGGK